MQFGNRDFPNPRKAITTDNLKDIYHQPNGHKNWASFLGLMLKLIWLPTNSGHTLLKNVIHEKYLASVLHKNKQHFGALVKRPIRTSEILSVIVMYGVMQHRCRNFKPEYIRQPE